MNTPHVSLMRRSISKTATFALSSELSSRLIHTIKLAECPRSLKASSISAAVVHPTTFGFCTGSLRLQDIMADDQSYNAFLTRVNQDPSANSSQEQSTSQAKSKLDPTTPQTSAVPVSLQNLDATYTSDSDEPFEPIVMDYAGHELPDVTQFSKCLKKKQGDVEALEEEDFDPQGQYKDIMSKVKEAGNGKARCFRVEVSKTRAEYYVVSVGERKLVGVRAKAVES